MGRETGRKGGGRCTGGGRRGGGKRDSQGSGKREKKGKIMQHCVIFRNRINAKGREPKNTGREPGLRGTGSGRFKPPCPPPLFTISHNRLGFTVSSFAYSSLVRLMINLIRFTYSMSFNKEVFSFQKPLPLLLECSEICNVIIEWSVL